MDIMKILMKKQTVCSYTSINTNDPVNGVLPTQVGDGEGWPVPAQTGIFARDGQGWPAMVKFQKLLYKNFQNKNYFFSKLIS